MMERFYFEEREFLHNPNLVRNIALQKSYKAYNYLFEKNKIWSGYRSKIDYGEDTELLEKLQSRLGKKIQRLSSHFNINPKSSMHGFPHVDSSDSNAFAGIIYLNDIQAENCGTTIYEDCPNELYEKYLDFDRLEILYCASLNENNSIKQQYSRECLDFKNNILKKIVTFELEFNKLVCYSANYLHSPDFYFGDTNQNSRLTLCFYGQFDAN